MSPLLRRVLFVLAALVLLIVILAFDQPRPPAGKLAPVREVCLRDALPGADYGDRT